MEARHDMSTPGNPVSLFNLQVRCPKCGNGNWNILLESACPQCGFRHQQTLDRNIKGMLGEHFAIHEVSRGGMGEVFICKFVDDANMKVAFKTFQMKLFFDKVSQDAFIREIINWMRLTGAPHIMPAIDLEYYEGRPFVMMPAIESDECGRKTLHDFISHGSLSSEEILKYSFQVAAGMHFAQMAAPGFVHGDLKPANIFIRNEQAFISDFGLSYLIHESSMDYNLESTYGYQAPELWDKSNRPSTLSDVYSFGIILYEMITGHLPSTASSREDWKRFHLAVAPTIPLHFEKGIKLKLLQLSLKCMKKKSIDRPTDFYTILQTLMKIGKQEDIVYQFEVLYDTVTWYEAFKTIQQACKKNLIRSLVKLDRIELALEELNKLSVSTFDAEMWALRGNVLSLQNRDEEAIGCFEKALKYDNLHAEAKYVYLIDLGLSLKRLKRFEDATKLYTKLLTEVPDSLLPRLVTNLSTVYLSSGQPIKAIELLRPFLMKNPELAEGWANLGLAYANNGEFELAVLSFRRALDVAPQLSKVRLMMAGVLMDDLGNMHDALDSLELAYRQGHKSAELYGRLIQCNLHERRFDRAKQLLEEMERDFSNDVFTRVSYSLYYRDTGDFQRALNEINLAILISPGNPELYFGKSIIQYLAGDITSEIDSLKNVLEVNPKHGKAAANLTMSLLKLKRFVEAQKYGKIAQACGTLPPEIEHELKFKENPNDPPVRTPSMISRLMMYRVNCPFFKNNDKFKVLSRPFEVDMERSFDKGELLGIVRSQCEEASTCPLPVMMVGLQFCARGRYDLASSLWKEAMSEWTSVPDFPLALGFVFETMLNDEKANEYFLLASKNGLTVGDMKSMKSVKCPACYNNTK
jgi:tetratricopeptide (TPR) repeat protein/tRNA A-37 threonylcarbamoyl transferase component Bud32